MIAVTHNDLHAFVRSLTKSEKRFFKLQIANHPKQLALSQLFDYFDKRAVHQTAVQEDFQAMINTAQTEKQYLLYEQILKSQRLFYADSIVNFRIKDDMDNLRLLFDKGQYKQCLKMLKPLKQLAYEHEKFHFALEVLVIEKEILVLGKSSTADETIVKITEEEKVFNLEKNLSAYIGLYAQVKQIYKQELINPFKENYPSIYLELLENPLLKWDERAISIKAQLLRHKTLGLCYTRLGDPEKREAHYLACHHLFETKDFLKYEMPRIHLEVFYNLIHVNLESKNFKRAEYYLKAFENINQKPLQTSIDIAFKYQSYLINSNLLLYSDLKQDKLLIPIAHQIEKHLSEHQSLISNDDYLVLLFNLINYYIFCGYYLKAKSYNALLFSLSDKNSRWDVQHYGRLQQLIIFYELEQEAQLQYALNTIHKLKTEQQIVSRTEHLVLQCFTNLISKNGHPKDLFSKLNAALTACLEDKTEEKINRFYINFIKYSQQKANL